MEVLGVDHIDLTVHDMDRSMAFYEKVFGFLGFRRVEDQQGAFILGDSHTMISLLPVADEHRGTAFDRFRVGLHHLALRVKERADVDRFHEFLVAEGVHILDAPAEYPIYGADYYAVFFTDPDGIKLEIVHYPWGYWRRTMTDGADALPRS